MDTLNHDFYLQSLFFAFLSASHLSIYLKFQNLTNATYLAADFSIFYIKIRYQPG